MPNYCENRLFLQGNHKEVEALLSFVKSDESVFDFNKIVPIPESIKNTERGSVAFASEAVCWYLKEKKITSHLRWLLGRYNKCEAEIPEAISIWQQENKVNLDLGYRIIENRKLYNGFGDWYEWCIEYWGTKWEACDPQISDDCVYFETAWTPPIPIIKVLAKLFPKVSIFHSYYEPGCTIAGEAVFVNGECFRHDDYEFGKAEYRRIASDFGDTFDDTDDC